MTLTKCPDCGTEISDAAAACVKCGRPMSHPDSSIRINRSGAWCPNCGNRDSYKFRRIGCFFWILVIATLGVALILYPLLSQAWRCNLCKNEW